MFISHKANVIQEVDPDEWQCRRTTKGMSGSEYWTWIATITDSDGVITYPSETFTIVECTDEDVQARLNQLGDYQSDSPATGTIYNIKWSNSKVKCEEIKDIDGNSHDPKQYVQSHFKGNNTSKNARLLADEWTQIRAERTRLIIETDHLALSDQTLSDAMTTYRQALRDIPTAQGSVTKYSQITWPTKP
tara:strand:+ start:70 stop:639 length:570 start_codon:yes stop_codon:yes gene_type:complete